MTEAANTSVVITFTPEEMAEIEAEAKEQGISVEQYCQGVVLDEVEEEESTTTPTLKPRNPRDNTIERKTLKCKDLKGGFDYSKCKIDHLEGNIPEDIGIFDSVYTGPGPEPWCGHYINAGIKDPDKNHNLWIVRTEFQPSGERQVDEYKISGVNVFECGTSKGKLRVRLRHGSRHVWSDCDDIDEMTVRDGLHKFNNLRKASISMYAGNLPWHAETRNGKPGWKQLRDKVQAGQRMYSSGECILTGSIGRIEVGRHSKNGDQYPAINHKIAKALRSVTKISADGNTTKFV